MIPESLYEPARLADGKRADMERMALIVLVGTALSLVFHYVMAFYFGLPYPYSTFLFEPKDRLNDFNNMYEIVKGFSPYKSSFWFQSNYFPFANLVFIGFALIPLKAVSLAFFIALFFAAYALFAFRVNKRFLGLPPHVVLLLFFLSYPVLFAVDRGNIEIYLFLCLAAFAYSYFAKKNDVAAGVFLGMAISMKLYPAVFIVLFLRDRSWKSLAWTAGTCAALTLGSMLAFKGGFVANIGWMREGFHEFSARSVGYPGIQHSSTLFSLVKMFVGFMLKIGIIRNTDTGFFAALESAISTPYAVAVFLAFAGICYVICRRKTGNHNAVLALTGAMQLFPFVSYDYKLISFLVPLALFAARKSRGRFDGAVAALYGVLLVPKDYFYIIQDISIAVPINALVISAMMVLALIEAPLAGDMAARPILEKPREGA